MGDRPTTPSGGRLRFALVYVLPVLLLLAGVVAPLIRGSGTLHLRDVFSTHLEPKWFQAEAMRDGYLPLVDPLRAGGQPHLGNPNTVPLYPTNLLYLVAPPLWALNAHFWIHLLLAPLCIFWLGRAWGLSREASWAGGVCFTASGFFLAQFNLYNMVAGVTLAPALAAAMLIFAAGRRRRWMFVAVALLWALLITAGDPMTAAAALALAAAAPVVRYGPRFSGRAWLLAALGLGTLVAAPQIVEFLRILPLSFRGHWGYSVAAATAASWNPATVIEWLIPTFFGTPDLGFWGRAFHGNQMPLFYSLAPGALAVALAAAAGRPRSRAAWWAWGLVAAGLFFALGRWNPIVHGILSVAQLDLLRFPVKLWTLVAVGGSLVCALGFERVYIERRRRGFYLALAALASFYLLAWGALNLFAGALDRGMRRLVPDGFPDSFVDHERLRWAGVCVLSLLLVAAAALLLRWGGRRPRLVGAITLLLHLGLQLLLLRLLLSTEPAELYRRQPPLLAEIPAAARVVHGDSGALFGPVPIPVGRYPDTRVVWVQRQIWSELYPFVGMIWGRHYELNLSPEGLDSFLTRATSQAIQLLPDGKRLRLLAASGVDYLILGRQLDPGVEQAVSLVHRMESVEREIHVYRILGSAEPVAFLGEVMRAPHLNAAVDILTSPTFDPRRAVVLPDDGPALAGPGGSVRVILEEPEAIELEVDAEGAGALVIQRTFLPIYRAEVDGRPATLEVANLHRMAIVLEPGSHHVRVWVDRVPLRLASALALLALAAIGGIALRLDGKPEAR